jgi:hypothetical protein
VVANLKPLDCKPDVLQLEIHLIMLTQRNSLFI